MIAQSELDRLAEALGASGLTLSSYLTATTILLASIVVGRLVRTAISRIVSPSRVDDFVGHLVGRLANYLVLAFGLIYTFETLGIAIGPILGALGIVGIALAFAFQDILENFVAGIILQLQRPFSSGDEVVTAGFEGVITSVDARTVTMRTEDGEIVRIPSADVIKQPIINHNEHGRRRSTVSVGVAYGSDLELVQRVTTAAVADLDIVLPRPEPQVLVEAFDPSSVRLAIRFWHRPSISDQLLAQHEVACAVAEAFAQNQLEIPLPHRVIQLTEANESRPSSSPTATPS